MTDRPVRATEDFIDDIDRQFSDERGPQGQPSRSDFYTYDMLEIRDRFAQQWDAQAELVAGRPDYRVVIVRGRFGITYAVEAQLTRDGYIEPPRPPPGQRAAAADQQAVAPRSPPAWTTQKGCSGSGSGTSPPRLRCGPR